MKHPLRMLYHLPSCFTHGGRSNFPANPISPFIPTRPVTRYLHSAMTTGREAENKMKKTEESRKRKREQATKKTAIDETTENLSYWLLKTEPKDWSWEDQRSNAGVSNWDGVKNRQAQNYLKSMKPGDRCFFYHSGPSERRIVGAVEVVRPWYTASDAGDGAVDVRSLGEMRAPVDLKDIKADPAMKDFVLLKQPRLSVVPVPEGIWERLCEMGGGFGEAAAD